MSLFVLSCYITAIVTVVLAAFVLLGNPWKKLNQLWFLESIAIVAWTVGLGGAAFTNNPETALLWQRLLYIGTIMIPIIYFHFCITLLELTGKKERIILWLGYIAAAFFVYFSFSSLFIIEVASRTDFGYWPVHTGGLYLLFLIYFIYFASYSVFVLVKNFKDKDGAIRKPIKYVYYATLIGFIGGSTNFLLDFNLSFYPYPYGNFFVAFYVGFITFAIVKHQLFDIKVIATELFIAILLILISSRLFVVGSVQEFIIQISTLIGTILFGVLLIRSVRHEVETREKGERLARYLANANARLRELDHQKTEFVSIASHQLRSPIAAIKGYAAMMSEGSYGNVPKTLHEPLKRILESGQRIGIMVDDFLNVTRIEQGRMTYDMKPHKICKILSSVVRELQVVANDKGLKLTVSCDEKAGVQIKADEGKIKQIFSNLIDNAIKYTQEGLITVTVESLEKEEKVLVHIKDTGIGIAPEEIKNLFQKFNRASNANDANVLGTGLGLYIAREIMKAHEGWIDVHSKGVGKGSTFTVELPAYYELGVERK